MTSQHFTCNSCGADVSLEQINQEDLAYVCSNARCQRTISVDCPEALRLRILATDEAGGDPFEDVVKLMKTDRCFDIGIAALINVTIDVVKSQRKRTATIEAIRYEAIAA